MPDPENSTEQRTVPTAADLHALDDAGWELLHQGAHPLYLNAVQRDEARTKAEAEAKATAEKAAAERQAKAEADKAAKGWRELSALELAAIAAIDPIAAAKHVEESEARRKIADAIATRRAAERADEERIIQSQPRTPEEAVRRNEILARRESDRAAAQAAFEAAVIAQSGAVVTYHKLDLTPRAIPSREEAQKRVTEIERTR